MQQIKVPVLEDGDTKLITLEIDIDTLRKLKTFFQIKGGEVKWDHVYMMSDDPRVFSKGFEQQKELESILNIKL